MNCDKLHCALVFCCCVSLVPRPSAGAQDPGQPEAVRQEAGTKGSARQPIPAEAELQDRLNRVMQAKSAGDVPGVAQASEALIVLGLRELAQLRLLQSAAPQAVKLYEQSLRFENSPETRVDLAIALLYANETEEAIRAANQAVQDDPKNVRAWNTLGKAWMMKSDYAEAARALYRAAEIAPDLESLYNLGISLLSTRDPADKARAPEVFQEMVKLAGDSGSIHVLFGRAYRDARDMSSAIREMRRAIALDTRTPHAHYFLGLAYMAQNEWVATPETRAEFKKELEFHPRDYLANYMLGLIASADRNYKDSDRYSSLAASVNPSAPDPWLYMGLNAYAQGNMPRAEECFRKAIVLTGEDNSRSNYQIRRAYINLGRILISSGRNEEGEPYLVKGREFQNKVLEDNRRGTAAHLLEEGADARNVFMPLTSETEEQAAPSHNTNADPFAKVDPSLLARASLTKEQKKQAEAQENQLRSVLAQGFSDLATSEAIRKDYAAALAHYQDAEHWVEAQPELMRNLGTAAFRAQNYGEAVRGLSVWLNSNPSDAPIRAMRGMAYFGLDNYADAAKTFAPLGVPGMQDSTVGYAWAVSATRTGELKHASEILAEYEKGKLSPETLLLVGQLWIEVEDYARSVAALHRALQADASLPRAHYFSGQADIRWQHWSEAADEFNAELALVPTDPDAKFNLGFVYLQQSKTDDAVELFRRVLVLHPDHVNSHYELGKILLDRGEMKEAIDHLEAAARLSPQTDYVHYQLQAAYRKESRIADADRELELYKELKAKSRERAAPQPVQRP
jgi:tetratricopeptide (TPR) repeat protein